eukprot:TRINITY_DN92982_c0_g1_i1.p1 TRINITY_DN92982_c0_g1~~TRINITY_DN92982_c0_g1_i1.p1  ORF type:complete len:361 (-),score=65.43 TRINITY_DN92982_c0_g1_i1:353-1435(-)
MGMGRGRAKGVAIAAIAVACVTPDAMLLRWARVAGATPWQTAFFKMNLIGLINFCSALYLGGGLRALRKSIASDPLALAFASLLQVGDQIGFTFSFLLTDTARAMLFISLNPMWAALMGYFLLGDHLPRRTIGLLATGIASTLVVFAPSLLAPKHQADAAGLASASEHQPETLLGDCIALATGFCLSSYVTFIRYCAKYRPAAAIDAAPSVGNFYAAALAMVMTEAVGDGLTSGVDLDVFLPVVASNALLVAIFYIGFTLAPRYITGAEVALIMLMETVCGPLWVYLRFGDVPSVWTMAGGALLVTGLAVHELLGLHAARVADADAATQLNAYTSPVLRLTSSPPTPLLSTPLLRGDSWR